MDAVVGMEITDQVLLDLLQCPACQDFLESPIKQCEYGHNICSKCLPRLTRCPVCRAQISGPRNLLAEKLIDIFMLPCMNAEVGCKEKRLLKDMKTHELKCQYREYECEFGLGTKCTWRGYSRDLMNHVAKNHAHKYNRGGTLMTTVHGFDAATANGYQDVSAMFVFNEMFMSFLKVDEEKQKIFGGVTYLGYENDATNFNYEFEVRTDISDRSVIQRNVCHVDFLSVDSIIETGDCFVLDVGTAKKFVTGDKLNVLVRVSRRGAKTASVQQPVCTDNQGQFLTSGNTRRRYINWHNAKTGTQGINQLIFSNFQN